LDDPPRFGALPGIQWQRTAVIGGLSEEAIAGLILQNLLRRID
jgi:hypothetical protein